MDNLLIILGFLCMLIGIVGSFMPAIPGISISWFGLVLLYSTNIVPMNYWVLGSTKGTIHGTLAAILTCAVACSDTVELFTPKMGAKNNDTSLLMLTTIVLLSGEIVVVTLSVAFPFFNANTSAMSLASSGFFGNSCAAAKTAASAAFDN